MFAHQVIDDLHHILNNFSPPWDIDVEHLRGMWRESIPLIRRADKFFMGTAESIDAAIPQTAGQILFMRPEYLKLPYKNCWFDYTLVPEKNATYAAPEFQGLGFVHNTKEAVHVLYMTDTVWAVNIFTYTTELGHWIPPVLPFIVFVGGLGYGHNRDVASKMLPWSRESMATSNSNATVLPLITQGLIKQEYLSGLIREAGINFSLLERSLMLLNCKNITTETHQPPAALNKARRGRGRQELFAYKTLKLKLPSHGRKGNGDDNSTGEHNRIHFCRGHFKEYTKDAPLFGRITGLWWWQSHVRGQNTGGIVMKDYKIEGRRD